MGPASPLDSPLTLAELVEMAAVGDFVESAAHFHGIGVALVDGGGRVVVEAPPRNGDRLDVRQRSVWGRRLTEGSEHVVHGAIGYLLRALDHDGVPLGTLVLGPRPAAERERLRVLAEHVTQTLSALFHAGYARHMATQLHMATLAATYEELADKNRRLAGAVERMQEVDRLKSNFLATISHELRTPLTSVIGYSEMLLEGLAGPLNQEQRDYVHIIMEKGDQLLQVITGILDVSRVEGGGLHVSREPVDVSELVRTGLAAMGPLARRKRLDMKVGQAAELRVQGDRDKLRQVVMALIGNAVKFTPEGGHVEVLVDVGPLHRDDDLATHPGDRSAIGVRMQVADDGIGIAPEKQERIFEPFFQVDSSSTREYGGTGLGLTLVKSYVEAHGGRVWVDSQLGHGSSFTVTLPAVEEDLNRFLRGRRRATSNPGITGAADELAKPR